jgi:hypothetical protein
MAFFLNKKEYIEYKKYWGNYLASWTPTTNGSNDDAWRTWCSDSGTTTSTNIVNDYAWSNWCSDSVTITTSASSAITPMQDALIWRVWCEQQEVLQSSQQEVLQSSQPVHLNPEEVRIRERAHILAQEQIARDKEAEKRALELLRSCLTPYQLKHFIKHNSIPVTTKKGNLYVIQKGVAGNIKKMIQDKAVESLCCHPNYDFPTEDCMLTQKLMLENDEDGFRKIANITPTAPPRAA